MSLMGTIGGVLGDIGGGLRDIAVASLPTAIPAGLEYLAHREILKTQKDMAKARGGVSSRVLASQRAATLRGGHSQMRKFTGQRSGTGSVLDQILIPQTPPYQQPSAFLEPEDIVGGIAGGAQWLFGNGAPTAAGGIPIASGWDDMFTPSGRVRRTTAVVNQQGRLEFMTNRGQPKIFTGDARICKDLRKHAGAAYRASGGSTSRKR